ncbi:peptidylprolyl isomerase [Chryseobacterium sp.]|uniref:peptidylprolyl isomerase n=1 Tax=Chryseobacterium sp. TaxID=1871047 RepID=UPI0028988534|nr:peptidylprolyl isomerase [Chryseobacterium sp.]
MKKVILFSALVFSTFAFSQNSGGVTIIESKKTDLKSELPKEKIKSFDQSFQNFAVALKNLDKAKIKSLLSEKVNDIVTDDKIKSLSGGINFERKMEIYKNGYQTIINGETYPALQYKFADDSSAPPKDLITVIFEENGKILGVKPEYSK